MPDIQGRLFDADGRDRSVVVTEDLLEGLGDRQLLWIDLERSDAAGIERLAELLELDERDVDHISTDQGRARLARSTKRLHLTLEALEVDDQEATRLVRREIDLLAARDVVVSVHDGRVGAVRRFDDGFEGDSNLGELDAAGLLSSLVDEVITGYFQVAESIDREIDELDQRALRGIGGDDVLSAIVALRRRISLVRRTLTPHRDALAALARPEMEVEATLGRPWTGLGDRLERAIDAIESLRDALLGTYDIYMGRVAHHANGVMKTLTLLSAVLLPAVVLAGVMGMNFQLPFFDDTNNFYVVLGGMVAFAVLILAVGRWRHWL